MTIYGQASRQLLDLAEVHHMTGHITWWSRPRWWCLSADRCVEILGHL